MNALERIIGISKRMRLGGRVAAAIAELLAPLRVAVHVKGVHPCTQMCGIRKT